MAKTDSKAKNFLNTWPGYTTMWKPWHKSHAWLRAQPVDRETTSPRILDAGSFGLRTQPDGMYVCILPKYGYVDVIAIEACGSRQNFYDKRSRYSSTTAARMVEVPSKWLLAKVGYKKGTAPRWKIAGSFEAEPNESGLGRFPVRHLRVLFAMPEDLLNNLAMHLVAAGHEYFCALDSLGNITAPDFRRFLERMAEDSHFYGGSWKRPE